MALDEFFVSPTDQTRWSLMTPSDHRSNELVNYGTLLLL